MTETARITAGFIKADPAKGSGNVLHCSNLSARYGRIQVFSGINFGVQSGELLVILGPNGAGKSSLLGAIAGCVSGGGAVFLLDAEIGKLPSHERAKAGVAFVPEMRRNIFTALTVEENLQLGLRLSPAAARVELLDYVIGLFPILKQRLDVVAGMMSGGEQQMLAIGMAVARRPRVLLLDEPTQGLAPAVFDILQNAFDLLKRDGLALVVAEQNLGFAARIADRFIVLSNGSIAMTGAGEELKRRETIQQSFFGEKSHSERSAAS